MFQFTQYNAPEFHTANQINCTYCSRQNDELLRNRECDMFDVDFDWDISNFTTCVDKRYGLTENGIYVNLESKELVKGYVKRFPREIHISYYYTNASNLELMECVGHELIHAYHLYFVLVPIFLWASKSLYLP